MNLNVLTLAKLADLSIHDLPSLSLSHIHLSTVAVREASKYLAIPKNLSLNTDLVNAVNAKDTKATAKETLKAFWSDFGLEHDEAIIIAFAVHQKVLPNETIKS